MYYKQDLERAAEGVALCRWNNPVELDNDSLVILPRYCNRSASRQISEYYRVFLLQERSYFPWSVFRSVESSYWLCQTYFSRVDVAVGYIVRAGCEPDKWLIQCNFYGPGYFLIAGDFDEALKFLGYSYRSDGTIEQEEEHEVSIQG